MRKNKGADKICINCAADQRLCFGKLNTTIPLLSTSEMSSLSPSSVVVQLSLCWTWSKTLKTGFFHDTAQIRVDMRLSMQVFLSSVCTSSTVLLGPPGELGRSVVR